MGRGYYKKARGVEEYALSIFGSDFTLFRELYRNPHKTKGQLSYTLIATRYYNEYLNKETAKLKAKQESEYLRSLKK